MSFLESSDVGGEIWSTCGPFQFESPLKDLLDSGDYSLEDLLAEDELLQELRGMHPQLVDFFSDEDVVTRLLHHLHRTDSTDGSDTSEGNSKDWQMKKKAAMSDEELRDLQLIRFPYMACEVICCDLPSILNVLVHGTASNSDGNSDSNSDGHSDSNSDGNSNSNSSLSLLDLLFSTLQSKQNPIDDRRAGYLEKITSLLFRKFPDVMRSYLHADNEADVATVTGTGTVTSTDNTNASSEKSSSSIHKHGGTQLMMYLFDHLHSFSIMQILQRLLLPPRSSKLVDRSQEDNDSDRDHDRVHDHEGEDHDEDEDEDDFNLAAIGIVRCNWSENKQVIEFLLDRLTGDYDSQSSSSNKKQTSHSHSHSHSLSNDTDANTLMSSSEHACEILITMIQNSPLNSYTMKALTSQPFLHRILQVITDGTQHSTMHESLMTTNMNVLESIILQLGGFGAVPATTSTATATNHHNNRDNPHQLQNGQHHTSTITMNGDSNKNHDHPNDRVTSKQEQEEDDNSNTMATVDALVEELPAFLQTLSTFLKQDTNNWLGPVQFSSTQQPLLGASRLRTVRLLESFVLLGHPQIDHLLSQSDALEICLQLFWQFPWCTMLHQSVANFLVHVMESATNTANTSTRNRHALQTYFVVRCKLLESLMSSFIHAMGPNTTTHNQYSNAHTSNIPSTISDDSNHNSNSNSNSNSSYTDLMLAMKKCGMESATSSVEAERGSDSSSTSSKDVDFIIPISDDDVDAALEQQQEAEEAAAAAASTTDVPLESSNHDQPSTTPKQQQQQQLSKENMTSSIPKQQEEEEEGITSSSSSSPMEASKEIFFRPGYMGHVIIICQALVHACGLTNSHHDDHDLHNNNNNNQQPSKEEEAKDDKFVDIDMNDDDTHQQMNMICQQQQSTPSDAPTDVQPLNHDHPNDTSSHNHPKNEFLSIVSSLPLYPLWQMFVSSSLAAEIALQSAPLGGYNLNANMNIMNDAAGMSNLRSFVTDDEDEDADIPSNHHPQPQHQYVAGGSIDLDDNELEIAASMMDALSFPPNVMEDADSSSSSGHPRHRRVMAGQGGVVIGKDFGTVVNPVKTSGEYYYDDPLGTAAQDHFEGAHDQVHDHQDDDDDDDDDDILSSKQNDADDDVPVIDLFAGNFNFEESSNPKIDNDDDDDDDDDHHPGYDRNTGFPCSSTNQEEETWADFANFDDAFAPTNASDFVTNNDDDDLFAAANSAEIIDASTDLFGTGDSMTAEDLFGPSSTKESHTFTATTTTTTSTTTSEQTTIRDKDPVLVENNNGNNQAMNQ